LEVKVTQQEIQAHPFFGKFQQRLPSVVNGMTYRGMINPNEQQMLIRMLKQSWNMIHQFIERLNMSYSSIDDNQMDNEIFEWLKPAVARIKQMSCGGGSMWGGGPMGGGAWGGGAGWGNNGGGGGWNNAWGGGGGAPSLWGTGNPNNANNKMGNMFGGTVANTQRKQQIEKKLSPEPQPVKKPVNWKVPEQVEQKTLELNGGVEITVTKYAMSTGDTGRSAIVYDPKVGYTSDHEVIEKYRTLFKAFPSTKAQFLTVFYQQLKAIPVAREEMLTMSQSIAKAVLKATNLADKLRAVVATAGHFGKTAYDEFSKLILDEFEFHAQCGELCDSAHPKHFLN